MRPMPGKLCCNQWLHTSEYKAAQIELGVFKKENQEDRKLGVLNKTEMYFLLGC